MKQEGEQKQNKEESSVSTLQKMGRKVYLVFCGSDQLDVVVNRSLVSNTYQQIIETLHIAFIYASFGRTNNDTYDIVEAVFSAVLILLCIIPRIVDKYYIFLIIIVSFSLVSLASVSATVILIINLLTFRNYCSILSQYALAQPSFQFRASDLCSSVGNLYIIYVVMTGAVNLIRVGYILLAVRAYKVSKKTFSEEQRRRRRKQRFDQNLKNKNPYSVNRKI